MVSELVANGVNASTGRDGKPQYVDGRMLVIWLRKGKNKPESQKEAQTPSSRCCSSARHNRDEKGSIKQREDASLRAGSRWTIV